LGVLFLCRSDAGWKTAWERIDWQPFSWGSTVQPQRYSQAPELSFDTIQSPEPPHQDEGEWKFSASRPHTTTLTVAVDQVGKITVAGEERTAPELLDFLCRAEGSSDRQVHVTLSIDTRCPLPTITLVTKICEDAGVRIGEFDVTMQDESSRYNVGLDLGEPST
jgi:hypothetical protein